MKNGTKIMYIIAAAIIGFCFGILDWEDRIIIICCSFMWIPMYVFYMCLMLIKKFHKDLKKALTDLKELKKRQSCNQIQQGK